VRDLGLLSDMDDKQYNRYRDTMSDWENDRNFAYQTYLGDVDKYQWQNEFDHTVEQDNIGNQHWDKEFNASNEHWNKEFDFVAGGSSWACFPETLGVTKY
jgi:hypothetical protein